MTKMKKKAWVSQKDLEQAVKKVKYLEKENSELKSKVQDMAEKYGEEVS